MPNLHFPSHQPASVTSTPPPSSFHPSQILLDENQTAFSKSPPPVTGHVPLLGYVDHLIRTHEMNEKLWSLEREVFMNQITKLCLERVALRKEINSQKSHFSSQAEHSSEYTRSNNRNNEDLDESKVSSLNLPPDVATILSELHPKLTSDHVLSLITLSHYRIRLKQVREECEIANARQEHSDQEISRLQALVQRLTDRLSIQTNQVHQLESSLQAERRGRHDDQVSHDAVILQRETQLIQLTDELTKANDTIKDCRNEISEQIAKWEIERSQWHSDLESVIDRVVRECGGINNANSSQTSDLEHASIEQADNFVEAGSPEQTDVQHDEVNSEHINENEPETSDLIPNS